MQFTASQIADIIQGKIIGMPEAVVHTFSPIETASPGTLSFVANKKYEGHLAETKATIVIVNEGLKASVPQATTLIEVKDAYSSFALLLEKYEEIAELNRRKPGIEAQAIVAESAEIGEQASIGAFSYISNGVKAGMGCTIYPGCYVGANVVLGNKVTLHPGVRIYQGCKIGNNVTIHAGSVIGADGFGFAPQADGSYKKIPQLGIVEIEDNVEIGANTTIDRATMGTTWIRAGAKLDNLIQIGHNADIGSHTVIAAQAGVSGSSKLGRHVMLGGQVGVTGHISLADGTKAGAQSGIAKSVKEPDQNINGSPAFEYRQSLRSAAIYRNLPEMQEQMRRLQLDIEDLKQAISAIQNT